MANTTCPAGSLRYSWRSGDTLVRIATAFGTTVSAMRDINPDVDFTKITAGTDVCIPTRMLTCPDSDLYAIQKGDTLSGAGREIRRYHRPDAGTEPVCGADPAGHRTIHMRAQNHAV